MTPTNARNGVKPSFHQPVAIDGLSSVFRTTGIKLAISIWVQSLQPAVIRRNGPLVQTNGCRCHIGWTRGVHTRLSKPALRRALNTWRSNSGEVAVFASGRAKRATSNPGASSDRRNRTISRIRRRMRFRTTADFEIFVPTTTVNRDCGRAFARNFTPQIGSNTPLPFAKRESMSFLCRRRCGSGNTGTK